MQHILRSSGLNSSLKQLIYILKWQLHLDGYSIGNHNYNGSWMVNKATLAIVNYMANMPKTKTTHTRTKRGRCIGVPRGGTLAGLIGSRVAFNYVQQQLSTMLAS